MTSKGATARSLEQSNDSKRDEILAMNDPDQVIKPSWLPKIPSLTKPQVKEEPKKIEPKKTEPAPKVVAAPPPPPPIKMHTLTIYNGGSVTRAAYVEDDKNADARIETTKSQNQNAGAKSMKGS